jgi:hypothetical protein
MVGQNFGISGYVVGFGALALVGLVAEIALGIFIYTYGTLSVRH